jgi:hypothetical protein
MRSPKVVIDQKTGHVYFSDNWISVGFKKVRMIDKVDITDELKSVLDWVADKTRLSVKKERLGDRNIKIICLCGSTRFKDKFESLNLHFTLRGHIVLSVGSFTQSDKELIESGIITEAVKLRLDELHKRKIDMADVVYFINQDGYIGESTKSELQYALVSDKEVLFEEQEKGEDFIREHFADLSTQFIEPQ